MGTDVCLLSLLCLHIEVSARGRSLVQRSPTECGVSECDHEASIIKKAYVHWGTGTMKKKTFPPHIYLIFFYLPIFNSVTKRKQFSRRKIQSKGRGGGGLALPSSSPFMPMVEIILLPVNCPAVSSICMTQTALLSTQVSCSESPHQIHAFFSLSLDA